MPNIPGLPEKFSHLKGVEMEPPPPNLLPDVTRMVTDAAKELAPGERGRLIWIATTSGVNLALVHKVIERDTVKVNVAGWIAKTWDKPIAAGIAGTVSW